MINIYYLEGTICNIFANAINTVAASQQAEHSAGESIAAFLSKLSFFNEHIVLVQWLIFLFTGVLYCFLIRKNKHINNINNNQMNNNMWQQQPKYNNFQQQINQGNMYINQMPQSTNQ